MFHYMLVFGTSYIEMYTMFFKINWFKMLHLEISSLSPIRLNWRHWCQIKVLLLIFVGSYSLGGQLDLQTPRVAFKNWQSQCRAF